MNKEARFPSGGGPTAQSGETLLIRMIKTPAARRPTRLDWLREIDATPSTIRRYPDEPGRGEIFWIPRLSRHAPTGSPWIAAQKECLRARRRRFAETDLGRWLTPAT